MEVLEARTLLSVASVVEPLALTDGSLVQVDAYSALCLTVRGQTPALALSAVPGPSEGRGCSAAIDTTGDTPQPVLPPVGEGSTIVAAAPQSFFWSADVGVPATNGLPAAGSLELALDASLADKAVASVAAPYLATVGLGDVAPQLTAATQWTDTLGMTHVLYEQTVDGVPVYGAQALVHLDAQGNARAINGQVLPNLAIDTTPKLSADEAARRAAQSFAAEYGSAAPGDPRVELYVLSPGMLENTVDSRAYLVWHVAFSDPEAEVAESYYVDAVSGDLIYRLSDARQAYYRKSYNCSLYASTDPTVGGYCWSNKTYNGFRLGRIEGASPAGPNPYKNGSLDVDNLYDWVGVLSDYYTNTFGRNSFNDRGGMGDGSASAPYEYIMGQTHCEEVSGGVCIGGPAFYSTYAVFCTQYVTPDTVGHEYSHAIAYYLHWDASNNRIGMLYQGLPGALQENFSDLAGEVFEKLVTGSRQEWRPRRRPCIDAHGCVGIRSTWLWGGRPVSRRRRSPCCGRRRWRSRTWARKVRCCARIHLRH
jgi:hypothetical protein